MTTWAVLLGLLGAVNPARRRTALNVASLGALVSGMAAALGAIAACALVGATGRDALDVSAPNARIAAGLVLVAVGLHAAVSRITPAAPVDQRPGAWLVPVAFPALVRPDVALVAFAAESPDVAVVLCGTVLACAATAAWWHLRGGSSPAPSRVERAIGAFAGALTVLAAVRLLLDGVFAL